MLKLKTPPVSRSRPDALDTAFYRARRHVYEMAAHSCHEAAQGWRMLAHHASPGTLHEMQEVSPTPPVLH